MNQFKNVNSSNFKTHPAAREFPSLGHKEYAELKADIKERGLVHPIVKRGNVILDGRNRLMACQELGITPRFVEYEGGDEVGLIIANNILRRHLTDDQRVAILAKLRGPALSREAEARMKTGHPTLKSAEGQGEAANNLAKEARVGRDKARAALDVAQHAKEIIEDVIGGKVPLRQAAKVAKARKPKARKPKKEKTLKEVVQAKFIRFMDYFPVTQHREVRKYLRELL